MRLGYGCIVFTTIFIVKESSSSLDRRVEIDLIDSQLQLSEDVITFIGAMSDDVEYFMEKFKSKSATSEEKRTQEEVGAKLKAFKRTMNDLLTNNNIFLKRLFVAAFPDKTEDDTPQESVKLGKNLLTHRVEMKRLFAYHLNHEGMELWRKLGQTLERNNTVDSNVGKEVLQSIQIAAKKFE